MSELIERTRLAANILRDIGGQSAMAATVDEAADALEAARVDAWRYRLMCQLIDDGDSRVDAAIGDAYNLGAGALDLFLDELPVVVEYMLDDAAMADAARGEGGV